jgi:hypothetical protein
MTSADAERFAEVLKDGGVVLGHEDTMTEGGILLLKLALWMAGVPIERVEFVANPYVEAGMVYAMRKPEWKPELPRFASIWTNRHWCVSPRRCIVTWDGGAI